MMRLLALREKKKLKKQLLMSITACVGDLLGVRLYPLTARLNMEKDMEIVKVIDYAPHSDEIKRLLRQTYELLNDHKQEEAQEHLNCWLKPNFF